ncbi:MAG TPA: dTMP kinase, partial [Solirubrobacterales bacterium]|nr:dTMP kinase [Solirubrobacterales bacterium]
VRPLLEEGTTVLLDRFVDSSLAYQGAGRGLGVDAVRAINDFGTGGLVPDLTLLLRIDPEAGLGRAAGDDRFEQEGLGLQRAVAEAYGEIAQIAGDRVTVIDATGTVEEVHERVMEAVNARVGAA